MSIDVTALVQSWANGAPADGVAMLPVPGRGVIARMVSLENTAPREPAEIVVTTVEPPAGGKGYIPQITFSTPGTDIFMTMLVTNVSETEAVDLKFIFKDRAGNLLVDYGTAAGGNVYDYAAKYPHAAPTQALNYSEPSSGATAAFTLPPGKQVYFEAVADSARPKFSGYGIIEYTYATPGAAAVPAVMADVGRYVWQPTGDRQRLHRTIPVNGGSPFSGLIHLWSERAEG